MNRKDFIRNAIRYLLFGVLATIVFVTGSKAVLASDCSSCPGKGICSGDTDCQKYLNGNDGKR